MKKEFSFAVSVGSYGGFNYSNKFSIRLCLGWIAFYYFPCDIEKLF